MEDQTNTYIVNPINTGNQDWTQNNISIIIPAYNCQQTIVQTLASIAMQENIHEIETIIADDDSDFNYDPIAEVFSNIMKLKIVRLKKGGGPGAARQVGFDHSVGKYVMFMDGDDSLIGCDAINILKKIMIEGKHDCVYGQFLEQSENGSLAVHEVHMVWMFGKLYRRSFLEHYGIRMNMSHSNEDTGFNCVVKGCSNKIWYIPKPVYTWRYKPNSITRFNNGMYSSESGMCGYLTNMIWQIKELEKRFINKNYILEQIVSIMCVLYHFYIENMQRYPLGIEANEEWIRFYYEQCYKPYEDLITESELLRIFSKVAAEQNAAGKGIIPRLTFFEFMDKIKSKPYNHDMMHDVGGSVIEIPQTTPEDYPVEIHEYMNNVMIMPEMNTNTNLARMDGMQRMLEKDKEQRKEFLEENIVPEVEISETEKVHNPTTVKDMIKDAINCFSADYTNGKITIIPASETTETEVPITSYDVPHDDSKMSKEAYFTNINEFLKNKDIEVMSCMIDKDNGDYSISTNKGDLIIPNDMIWDYENEIMRQLMNKKRKAEGE